jgi:hypothetical protein
MYLDVNGGEYAAGLRARAARSARREHKQGTALRVLGGDILAVCAPVRAPAWVRTTRGAST